MWIHLLFGLNLRCSWILNELILKHICCMIFRVVEEQIVILLYWHQRVRLRARYVICSCAVDQVVWIVVIVCCWSANAWSRKQWVGGQSIFDVKMMRQEQALVWSRLLCQTFVNIESLVSLVFRAEDALFHLVSICDFRVVNVILQLLPVHLPSFCGTRWIFQQILHLLLFSFFDHFDVYSALVARQLRLARPGEEILDLPERPPLGEFISTSCLVLVHVHMDGTLFLQTGPLVLNSHRRNSLRLVGYRSRDCPFRFINFNSFLELRFCHSKMRDPAQQRARRLVLLRSIRFLVQEKLSKNVVVQCWKWFQRFVVAFGGWFYVH